MMSRFKKVKAYGCSLSILYDTSIIRSLHYLKKKKITAYYGRVNYIHSSQRGLVYILNITLSFIKVVRYITHDIYH